MLLRFMYNMMYRRVPTYGNAVVVPGYVGPLFRLRRSGDNATFDVYPSTILNNAALLVWALGRTVSLDAHIDQKQTGAELKSGSDFTTLGASVSGLLGLTVNVL